MSKKEALVRIPKANKPPRTAAADKRTEPDPTGPDRTAEPDLSHIAPGLRALAKPIADLMFHAKNPRKHNDANIEAIRGNLAQRGQYRPAIISRRTGRSVVIVGNGMLQAALAEGWQHLAVEPMELTEAEEDALAIADNQTSAMATWDQDVLVPMLAQLKDAPIKLCPKLNDMMDKLRTEAAPKTPKTPAAAQPEPAAATPTVIQKCPACGHQW